MRTGSALICVTLLTAAAPAQRVPPQHVQRLLQASPDGPGCAIAIVDNGAIAFEQGYGLADVERKVPITPRTSFNIASMTKQFTGMAVALLIADGKLNESDDIRKFLPELKRYGPPITVANLLNHSSGLRNHMALAVFQPGDHLPSHAEALALVFRQSALNFAPGTRHQYESPNYVLLAEIVARVSGMPFERFVDEQIIKPMGMLESGYSVSPAPSYGGSATAGWVRQDKVNRALGSSGLKASVRDFALWMLNYDQRTVGGSDAAGRMLSTSRLADGSVISYRYGLIKEADYAGVKGLTRISHGGFTGAYRSAFSYFPGRGFGSVVMCNHLADVNAIDLAITSDFVGRLKPPQPASVGGSGSGLGMPADVPGRYAGIWYSKADDDIREFTVKDGGLALRLFGEEYPLRFRSERVFALEDQGEYRFGPGGMEEVFAGQARLRFERLPPSPAQDLSGLEGTYRSPDVDGTVTLAKNGAGLTLTYPAGQAKLRQIGHDHFASPEEDFNSVRFLRDQVGRVTGLTLTTGSGITRMRFVKAAR